MEPEIELSFSQPWWRTDPYTIEAPIPKQFDESVVGPRGIALVRAWPDGTTEPGWGLTPPKKSTKGFMPRYMAGQFKPRWVLPDYFQSQAIFAFVMRSLRLVAIDIDGKNGGLEAAAQLGPLPPTLAEISKSGTGYHLFYRVEDEWHDDYGFGALGDRIGIEQGVDVRGTGCIYHHPQQRWNERAIAPLPQYLHDLILRKNTKVAETYERIEQALSSDDKMELMMVHGDLMTALKKPIPAGKRNNTLFAIGQQMKQAQVPQWQELIRDRAHEVGLPVQETEKLVANIERY